MILISGNDGCGKSTIIHHVLMCRPAFRYRWGRRPYLFSRMVSLFLKSRNKIVSFDIGSHHIAYYDARKWELRTLLCSRILDYYVFVTLMYFYSKIRYPICWDRSILDFIVDVNIDIKPNSEKYFWLPPFLQNADKFLIFAKQEVVKNRRKDLIFDLNYEPRHNEFLRLAKKYNYVLIDNSIGNRIDVCVANLLQQLR